MLLVLIASLLSGLIVLAYWLGLFDRPKFVQLEDIVPTKKRKELFAVLATSTCEPSVNEVCNLLSTAKKAMDSHRKAAQLLSQGAAHYGTPKGANGLSIIVYFESSSEEGDNNNTTSHQQQQPQWASGFLVDAETIDETKKLVDSLSTSNLKYPVQAMKLGSGPVLRGRIPWRNKFTPLIAKYLHWNRAFDRCDSDKDIVACEVYVTGPKDSFEHIDLLLLDADKTSLSSSKVPNPQ
jgi:hypothetical protein